MGLADMGFGKGASAAGTKGAQLGGALAKPLKGQQPRYHAIHGASWGWTERWGLSNGPVDGPWGSGLH